MGFSATDGLDPGPFASPQDLRECLELHRKHGTTYFFASRLFSKETRIRTHALYGFVRVPDEWVDNPVGDSSEAKERLLQYRAEFIAGVNGKRPSVGVLRAFCDVMKECAIPICEPLLFLDAMEQDLAVNRYQTYEDLRGYMRGSASAVGAMMTHILCDRLDSACLPHAMASGEAMQMTNFLRDIGEDARRGRIYLPLEDLRRFGVDESSIFDHVRSPRFEALVKFEIERTRLLYAEAEAGLPYLPPRPRKAVRLALILYSRILDRIEACDFDVFQTRARTSKTEKIVVAARVFSGLSVS